MPGEFEGKVVVVSGASRGIGRGIALAFAREGAQTVLASSSAENLAVAAKAIAGLGPEPFTVAGDLRTLAACEQLFARVNERFARCDVLVNNAGATRAGAFVDLPDAVWLEGYALKFFGCVRLTRLFWPLLKASQGNVINIIGGAARKRTTRAASASRKPSPRWRCSCVPSVRATSRARRSRSMAVRPPVTTDCLHISKSRPGVLARAHGGWSHS